MNIALIRAAGPHEDTRTGPNQVLRPIKVPRTGPNQVLDINCEKTFLKDRKSRHEQVFG